MLTTKTQSFTRGNFPLGWEQARQSHN